MAGMMHWIQHHADRPMAIRADGDPFEDPDVVPEYWGVVSQGWVPDADLNGEIFWNPSIRSATADEIQAITG